MSRIIYLYYSTKMTDVSTYIEAEDNAAKFYEKNDQNVNPLDYKNYSTVYLEPPQLVSLSNATNKQTPHTINLYSHK
jgi:hypothetical protein